MRLIHSFAALLALLAVSSWAVADESIEERRARVEQMDAEQKDQLLQNYQRFVRLDEAERERLRKLHGDLETAADQAELRNVLQRYNDWLNDLPPNQRADVLAAPPEERLKKIESLTAAQKKQESSRLGAADIDAMRSWIQAHGLDVKLNKMLREGGEKPEITEEQIAELRGTLTEDGRKKLDEAIAEDAKRKGKGSKWSHRSVSWLLFTWYGQTSPRRGMLGWNDRGPGGPGGGQRSGFHRPSEAELQSFLKNDIPEQQRAELLNLPHDEMQMAVRRMWMTREFRRHDERQRSGGFGDVPGDDRRPRGPGEKQRGDRPRRGSDGPGPAPAPEKAAPDKTPAEKPAEEPR